jgi:hypothetical protein
LQHYLQIFLLRKFMGQLLGVLTVRMWILTLALALAELSFAQQRSFGSEARLMQGQFRSSDDQRAFEQAFVAAVGTALRIENPGADPSNGDGAASDAFGRSVAVQGDIALVGVPFDNLGAKALAGSVYVFNRVGSNWVQQSKLIAGDAEASDGFGRTVAWLGDIVLIGAPSDDVGSNVNQGSVYVFAQSGNTWVEQTKLLASDGAGVQRFGTSLSLSGNTAVIGSSFDSVGGIINGGSVFVFVRVGNNWTQQARLVATDSRNGDQFGESVGISTDTVLVGAPSRNAGSLSTQEGAAYVFIRTGSNWAQQAKLVANDADIGDLFGSDVALRADIAVIGASLDDETFEDQGSVYVFARSGTIWSQQTKLTIADAISFGASIELSADTLLVSGVSLNITPNGAFRGPGAVYVFAGADANWTLQTRLQASDGENFDGFGWLAFSGNTVLVGAPGDRIESNANQGSAYVFTRTGANWSEQAKLTSGLGASNERFGNALALFGDTAVVGAALDDVGANADQGAAYVFTRVANHWLLQARLTAADGAAGDQFGFSVAVSANSVLIGSYLDDVGDAIDQGSAYVFTRSGNTWSQQIKLTSDDSEPLELFGYAVAMSGDSALIGARGDRVAGINQGTAYVFTRAGTSWSFQQKLFAANGLRLDFFGLAVALAGNTALIGASGVDTIANADQGAVYVFTRVGNSWSQQAQLFAADGAAFDLFGGAVALSGDSAVIGALTDDVGTNNDQGSAYVFTRSGSDWSQQSKLVATDGAANDRFGSAVTIFGDTIVIGSPLDTVGSAARQGSAHLFTRASSAWSLGVNLLVNDAQTRDEFGISVATSGETTLVGAHNFDTLGAMGNPDVGAVYAFSMESLFKNGFEN